MDWRSAAANVVQFVFAASGSGFDRVWAVTVGCMRLKTERLRRVLIVRGKRRHRRIVLQRVMVELLLLEMVLMMMVMKYVVVMGVATFHARIAVVAGKVQRKHVQIIVRWNRRKLVQLLLARALGRDVGAARGGHVARTWQRRHRPSPAVAVLVGDPLDRHERKVDDARRVDPRAVYRTSGNGRMRSG